MKLTSSVPTLLSRPTLEDLSKGQVTNYLSKIWKIVLYRPIFFGKKQEVTLLTD